MRQARPRRGRSSSTRRAAIAIHGQLPPHGFAVLPGSPCLRSMPRASVQPEFCTEAEPSAHRRRFRLLPRLRFQPSQRSHLPAGRLIPLRRPIFLAPRCRRGWAASSRFLQPFFSGPVSQITDERRALLLPRLLVWAGVRDAAKDRFADLVLCLLPRVAAVLHAR